MSHEDTDVQTLIATLAILTNMVQSGTGVSGGSAVSGGATASQNATDNRNNADTDVNEAQAGLVLTASQQVALQQSALNAVALKNAESASFYTDLLRSRSVDHADQNHTRQMTSVPHYAIAAEVAEDVTGDDPVES